MRRIASLPDCLSVPGALWTIGVALALVVSAATPSLANSKRNSEAGDQFTRAVKMRTMLEGLLERDRSVDDYKKTIAAYHKVYLIDSASGEATAALIAEAELYQEMGRLYGVEYFHSSIKSCNFLISQYPGSRYRGDALLAIAQIQKENLNQPNDAKLTYTRYLQLFPHSEKADQVRTDLKELAEWKEIGEPKSAPAERQPAAAQPVAEKQPGELPELKGDRVGPRIAEGSVPEVKSVQSWNRQDSARLVVALSNTIDFKSMRIASPDRIFFDLRNARLNPKISTDGLADADGLLKSVRIAQNKPNVVRVVLDVSGARDYSAYLLENPYRFVIEVRSQHASVAKSVAPPGAAASVTKVSTVRHDDNAPGSTDNAAEVPPVATTHASGTPFPATPALKVAANTVALPVKPRPDDAVALGPATVPKLTRDGQRSLTRTLGLKINRIVIDPGHGGHDTGTIGPHGLMEKDVCLDVALRLGHLIEETLPGTQVIYTRKDDTFVPLEERTAIANQAQADLFISIHANSSRDPSARGIETYYLNFTSSAESMEVAARENANSDESLHDLQDLIKKIARNDKMEESRELAEDIQDTLSQRMQLVSRTEKNRGVKKAPFVVLIGANMPSVLAEMAFVSNPNDEKLLRKPDQRQRIADGLYRGIATYLKSLNSFSYDKRLASDNSDSRDDSGGVASTGNPK
jgi:N-acetylmuramoyl-L-alanine amidase